MPGLEYFVALHNGKWRLTLDGTSYGPFKTRADAIRTAIDAAGKWGKNGREARVFVQEKNKEWKIEWSYSRTPYLPAA